MSTKGTFRSAAVCLPALTESTVSWLPQATSAGTFTLSNVEAETPWMPCPSIDANAAAVPLTRNGRSHCSMKARLKGGGPDPQALATFERGHLHAAPAAVA